MFSVDSASARCTKQVLLPRFFQDQVGNRFFSSFSPSKMLVFLFENTTLGPPKQSLAVVAWLFFLEPKSQGVTLELKKRKLKYQSGNAMFPLFGLPVRHRFRSTVSLQFVFWEAFFDARSCTRF
jgi:hypothetical protein